MIDFFASQLSLSATVRLRPPAQLFAPSQPIRSVSPSMDPQPTLTIASGKALPVLTFEAPDWEAIRAGAVLEPGQSGDSVTGLQQRLNSLGFSLAVTGNFNVETQTCLQDFQRSASVEPTGRLGPTTLKALERAERSAALALQIAHKAESIASARNTVGSCYEAVAEAIESQIPPFLWGMSAWMAADQLAASPAFREISPPVLTQLPAGAIVVWEKGSSPHGHISVALGDGREASDHLAEQMTSHYGGGKARVFLAQQA